MLAAQKAIRISQVTGRFVVPSRTAVVSPPRVRISFPEKVCHGVAIAIGVLAIPCYIALNIKNYRK